jgi:hypothetical protein
MVCIIVESGTDDPGMTSSELHRLRSEICTSYSGTRSECKDSSETDMSENRFPTPGLPWETFWKSMDESNTFWKSMDGSNTFWKSMSEIWNNLYASFKHASPSFPWDALGPPSRSLGCSRGRAWVPASHHQSLHSKLIRKGLGRAPPISHTFWKSILIFMGYFLEKYTMLNQEREAE